MSAERPSGGANHAPAGGVGADAHAERPSGGANHAPPGGVGADAHAERPSGGANHAPPGGVGADGSAPATAGAAVATAPQRGPSAVLSADALARIDRELAKYPASQKQSAVMAALAIAQDEKGWLAAETMDCVARYLGMPPVAVYEVATFYAMYNLKPIGAFKITLCTNLPCALQGASDAALHLREKLGVAFGETTADGRFTLQEGECMGACGDAPVLLVNNKRMCSWMRPAEIDRLLAELAARPAPANAPGEGAADET